MLPQHSRPASDIEGVKNLTINSCLLEFYNKPIPQLSNKYHQTFSLINLLEF